MGITAVHDQHIAFPSKNAKEGKNEKHAVPELYEYLLCQRCEPYFTTLAAT